MYEIRKKSNGKLLSTGLTIGEVRYLITWKNWPKDQIVIKQLTAN